MTDDWERYPNARRDLRWLNLCRELGISEAEFHKRILKEAQGGATWARGHYANSYLDVEIDYEAARLYEGELT
jgi:hypothetical protein